MNDIVPVRVAKSMFLQLVKRVAAGETICIGAYGRARVKLVSAVEVLDRPQRQFGLVAGTLRLPADLDAALPDDVLASFEGDR